MAYVLHVLGLPDLDKPSRPVQALAELAKQRKNRVRIGSSQAIAALLRHLKASTRNHALALPILLVLESITNKGMGGSLGRDPPLTH